MRHERPRVDRVAVRAQFAPRFEDAPARPAGVTLRRTRLNRRGHGYDSHTDNERRHRRTQRQRQRAADRCDRDPPDSYA
jgi:hypothetical protein